MANIEINQAVLDIIYEAFEAHLATRYAELDDAKDEGEREIFKSQILAAKKIQTMICCGLHPGETITLVAGGPDATIQPCIKQN